MVQILPRRDVLTRRDVGARRDVGRGLFFNLVIFYLKNQRENNTNIQNSSFEYISTCQPRILRRRDVATRRDVAVGPNVPKPQVRAGGADAPWRAAGYLVPEL